MWAEAQPLPRKFVKILCKNNAFCAEFTLVLRKRAAASTLNLPLIKDFKTESAVFPAKNQPKISSDETQPEKIRLAKSELKKMCQPEFGH